MDRSKCSRPMPAEQQTCQALNSALCSSVRWSTGPWDDVGLRSIFLLSIRFCSVSFQCSATCGTGIQQRSVYCDDPSRPWIRIPDSECLNLLGEHSQPAYRQNCSITECPRWETSPWSKCSGQCGVAERRRRIYCSHNGRELEDNYCLQINGEKPTTTEKCSPDEYCPSWTTGMWSEVRSRSNCEQIDSLLSLVFGSDVFSGNAISTSCLSTRFQHLGEQQLR